MKSKGDWKKHILGLIISIAIAEGVGILSALFTRNSMQQYKLLIKPSFSPPSWVFPVVWTILYLLMGIASYRIYSAGIHRKDVKNALIFYILQLIFNFLWTIIFFTLQLRGFAYIWILILFVLILITTMKFYKIDKVAAYLMVPYIFWVGFASMLNYSVWKLNSNIQFIIPKQ